MGKRNGLPKRILVFQPDGSAIFTIAPRKTVSGTILAWQVAALQSYRGKADV
jgi:hypothetical protein